MKDNQGRRGTCSPPCCFQFFVFLPQRGSLTGNSNCLAALPAPLSLFPEEEGMVSSGVCLEGEGGFAWALGARLPVGSMNLVCFSFCAFPRPTLSLSCLRVGKSVQYWGSAVE